MCIIKCPNCQKETTTLSKQECAFAGVLKAKMELSVVALGGVCPRCHIEYKLDNAPRIHLCAQGDKFYNKAVERLEDQRRIQRMNTGMLEKANAHAKKVRGRKVA